MAEPQTSTGPTYGAAGAPTPTTAPTYPKASLGGLILDVKTRMVGELARGCEYEFSSKRLIVPLSRVGKEFHELVDVHLWMINSSMTRKANRARKNSPTAPSGEVVPPPPRYPRPVLSDMPRHIKEWLCDELSAGCNIMFRTKQHLVALSRVNKEWNELVSVHLYKNIDLQETSPNHIELFTQQAFRSTNPARMHIQGLFIDLVPHLIRMGSPEDRQAMIESFDRSPRDANGLLFSEALSARFDKLVRLVVSSPKLGLLWVRNLDDAFVDAIASNPPRTVSVLNIVEQSLGFGIRKCNTSNSTAARLVALFPNLTDLRLDYGDSEPEGRSRLRQNVGSLKHLKFLNTVNSDLLDEEDFSTHPWTAPISTLVLSYSRTSLPIFRQLVEQLSPTLHTLIIFGYWSAWPTDPTSNVFIKRLPNLKTLQVPSHADFGPIKLFNRCPIEEITFMGIEPALNCALVMKVLKEFKKTLKVVQSQVKGRHLEGDLEGVIAYAKKIGVELVGEGLDGGEIEEAKPGECIVV